ncbi:polysaccharide lyase-like protein family 4 [Paraphoma chrysanthemicola]|uniref:rhamnogalacturonan endolyase n=1 Tax=Paraphoma chrysanthemicola TaxID=798071 RepID=A0A8K0QYZ7_9PLEO|nr:polysaccharide lyase-like protein family 4 [Paraphoma chrysanthemicola]
MWPTLISVPFWASLASAAIQSSEDGSTINISNNRLSFAVSKSSGSISKLSLDGQNLLGSGRGPYLDCHCVDDGFWTPGNGAKYQLFKGTDGEGKAYAGAMMSQDYKNTGKVLEQYWFLRDGETGMHVFARAKYSNSRTPSGGDLGEMRQLFRPSNSVWTHLSSSDEMYAPLPDTSGAPVVQDASWYVGGNKDHPYVKQMSDYFTKYMFSEEWRDQTVHGLYGDGSKSGDGSTYGAWLVMNTKDTYFNGPTHSDLTVDGIVYNYLVSNHHGNGVPEMVNGFDRTFGPQVYYFNKGAKGTSLQSLRSDAAKAATNNWTPFYDTIAKHVPNLVPSSGRGTFKATIALPKGATRALAVLALSGSDFQDNNKDGKAYQYWGNIDASGSVSIPSVKAGTYRLTVYADGIFGQYEQDGIVVKAGSTATATATWTAESAGTELWRIGTPDKSGGEFRHGNEKDTTKPLQPRQYRLYWAVHDFVKDFPNGVKYKVGTSSLRDLNYVHWSVFGGKANYLRKDPYYTNVNNWTLTFDLTQDQILNKSKATFTVQLAGIKTSAGNNDDAGGKAWANLPYNVVVNGKQLETWTIPSSQSSSCAVRSAQTCYTTGHKFEFPVSNLKAGSNEFVLNLPARATAPESAVLPESVYLQYDALRLEVR